MSFCWVWLIILNFLADAGHTHAANWLALAPFHQLLRVDHYFTIPGITISTRNAHAHGWASYGLRKVDIKFYERPKIYVSMIVSLGALFRRRCAFHNTNYCTQNSLLFTKWNWNNFVNERTAYVDIQQTITMRWPILQNGLIPCTVPKRSSQIGNKNTNARLSNERTNWRGTEKKTNKQRTRIKIWNSEFRKMNAPV